VFLTNLLSTIVTFVGGALNTAARIVPGVAQTPIYQEIEGDLSKYATAEANYMNHQSVPIAPFSHTKDGVTVAGHIYLVPEGAAFQPADLGL
jgi:hypothetical protein